MGQRVSPFGGNGHFWNSVVCFLTWKWGHCPRRCGSRNAGNRRKGARIARVWCLVWWRVLQGSLNATHFGGIKPCKFMVIFRDFPYIGALFGLGIYNDPCSNSLVFRCWNNHWYVGAREQEMMQFSCFEKWWCFGMLNRVGLCKYFQALYIHIFFHFLCQTVWCLDYIN